MGEVPRMKLLAFETATEACSVALWIDGEVRERFDLVPRRHAELALPWAEQLLADAGIARSRLDAVAVGRGPGAFTGVRLGVALAQGIALALDVPVLPVSTLAALAAQATGDRVLAAIDARMGEMYFGLFGRAADGLVVARGREWIGTAAMPGLPDAQARVLGIGSGFNAEAGALRATLAQRLVGCDGEGLPHAADVARLGAAAWTRGEAIAADALEPAYLRNKVALTLDEQAQARAAK